VSDEDGHLVVSTHYLRTGNRRDIYLDVVHELVHVRQFREGKQLFPEGFNYPGCAHGDRGVQGVHRGRAAARDDGPRTVQVPEGRVDGCGRVAPARPERGSKGPVEAPWPTETVGAAPNMATRSRRVRPEML